MNPLPPLTERAKEWIKENVNSDTYVFEYGSGTSTLYFSKFAKSIVSVEHNKKMYDKVLDQLNNFKQMKISQAYIKYELIMPVKSDNLFPYSHESFTSQHKNLKDFSLKKYVKFIENFQDLDIVLINGRARASCIKYSIGKIKKGSYLILNNSLNFSYNGAIDTFLRDYSRIDFRDKDDQTSIWIIN